MSTGARRRRNGASDSRTVTEAFRNGGASADVSRRRGRRLQDCQEWSASDVPHWTKSAGTTPPPAWSVLERAASVRTHAYARGRVRVCVCVCAACIGLHEPHHSVISTRDHHRSSGNLVIKG